MAAAPMPNLTSKTGCTMPQIGFGTLNVPSDRRQTRENTEKTAQVVGLALELGYRHIDTAQSYGNERGVGEAIAASGIPREELYVTSKLGNGNHRPDDVRRSFDETLEKLGLERLDLFLIHWPNPQQDRYVVKKVPNNTSVGVGVLGSISVPLSSSNDSLVKVGSETIPAGPFYDRYFALMHRLLDDMHDDR